MKDQAIDAALKVANYKEALRLINTKIKQYPNSSYFYALKAQTLALDGQRDEALTEAQNLLAKCPSDPHTLTVLTDTFDLCDYELQHSVWETVSKKYPTFQLIYEWFTTCIRQADIVELQKSTMMLTKTLNTAKQSDINKPDTPRITKLWAATAFLLVCRCCPSRANLKLFPMLGLRFVEAAQPHTAQEYYVYCQLLDLVGKHDQCLSILKEFLSKENDLELKLLYLELLDRLDHHDQLFDVTCKYLVDLHEDDWDTWKWLIKAATHTGKAAELLAILDDYPTSRNSLLAYIEVSKYVDSVSHDQSVSNYLAKFGHKKCCYLDLKLFVDEHDIPTLEEHFQAIAPVLAGARTATQKDLGLMVNYLKFKAFLEPSIRDTQEFMDQCCQFYAVTKHLLADLQEFEFFEGFEFIILAAQSLLAQVEPSPQVYLNLIIIFEVAAEKNTYEFHLKLWLIKLYMKVNMVTKAQAVFESLKVKFVQLDTLGPLLLTRYSSVTTKDSFLSSVSRFYDRNVRDEVPHMTITGFDRLALTKIQGFLEFKIRLDTSLTKFLLSLETVRSSRTQNKTVDASALRSLDKVWRKHGDDIDLKINDNRDVKTFWDCGIHEVSTFKDSLNPDITVEYLAIQGLKELLIYNYKSSLYDEYVDQFLKLYKQDIPMTPIEKWNLSIFANVFDPSIGVLPLPKPPTSTLDFNFNHHYLVLADTLKQVAAMLGSHTGRVQAQISSLQSTKKLLTTGVKAARENTMTFRDRVRQSVSASKELSLKWFVQGEGKPFGILPGQINQFYEDAETANTESISYLKI